MKPTKREKAAIYTTEAHLKNMFKGVLEGSIYKLKIKFNSTIKIVNLSFTESDESFIGTEFLTGLKLTLDLKKLLISLD